MTPPSKNYFVYILSNLLDTVLYIGITNDLVRRLYEHKQGIHDGFTKKYHVHKLVCFGVVNEIQIALAREKELKGWSRMKKIRLIEEQNPDWKDLGRELR